MRKEEIITFRVTKEEKAKYDSLNKNVDFPNIFRSCINNISKTFPAPCGKIENPLTEYQLKEFNKCKDDIIYFAKNYFYLISPRDGKQLFSYDYTLMADLLSKMTKHDNIITLKSRQIGMTTINIIYTMWKSIFFNNISIGLVSPKEMNNKRSIELFDFAYNNLPDWMKPHLINNNNNYRRKFTNNVNIYTLNPEDIIIDNKGEILFRLSSSDYHNINDLDTLLFDEMAFFNKQPLETLTSKILSNITCKLFVNSTSPYKRENPFIQMYLNKQSDSKWITHKIAWYDVPGRNNQWKETQIKSFNNDQQKFDKEFGCIFE
jgi:hypothetical protein